MSTASHSGHSHSGHSHSGHGLSGNAMAEFAGLDAYAGFTATGMLADGMLLSREAIVGALSSGVPPLPFQPALPPPPARLEPDCYKAWMLAEFPAVDQSQHMARWAPHIRAHILDVELLSAVRFLPGKDAAGAAQQDSATLADSGGNRIATLVRPKIGVFGKQVDKVMQHAILREDRTAEILTQVVPPISYFASVLGLSEVRTRFTMELMSYAQRFAMLVLMRFKHAFACPRPFEYSPLVQPLLDTPPFSALPSGHATECYMFAGVVRRLTDQEVDPTTPSRLDKQLQALAERIATNRVVAGLHFPIDNIAGRMLGETLAEYFVHVSRGALSRPTEDGWVPRTFDGRELDGTEVFDPTAAMDNQAGRIPAGAFQHNTKPRVVTSGAHIPNHHIKWLWDRASTELQEMGFFA